MMSTRKLRFALFGNTHQAKKSAAVKEVLSCLSSHQATIYIDKEYDSFLKDTLHMEVSADGIFEDSDFDADFVISMGGDGTFLRAASKVRATGGLMSRTSNAAKAAGGYVIGVIPPRIISAGRKATNCDDLYRVRTMSERKQAMRDIADIVVCLPGSYGTLDEMMDVISSGIVGEHKKPVFVLNYKGFYEPLKAQIELMRSLQFIPEQEAYKPIFVNSLDELYEQIQKIN